MRLYELECSHGIGHSSGVHGCDGCCGMLAKPAMDKERERIIKVVEEKIQATTSKDVHEREGLFAALRLMRGEQDND